MLITYLIVKSLFLLYFTIYFLIFPLTRLISLFLTASNSYNTTQFNTEFTYLQSMRWVFTFVACVLFENVARFMRSYGFIIILFLLTVILIIADAVLQIELRFSFDLGFNGFFSDCFGYFQILTYEPWFSRHTALNELRNYISRSAVFQLTGLLFKITLLSSFWSTCLLLTTAFVQDTYMLIVIIQLLIVLIILALLRCGAPRFRIEQLTQFAFNILIPAVTVLLILIIIIIMFF